MKRIIITNIDFVEAENTYTQIAHSPVPVFKASEPEHPDSFVSLDDLIIETVETHHFYTRRNDGYRDSGEPKYVDTMNIMVGMSRDVQKAMRVYVEGATDAFNAEKEATKALSNAKDRLEALMDDNKHVCLLLEEEQVKNQRYTSMSFWRRLKWAFTKK